MQTGFCTLGSRGGLRRIFRCRCRCPGHCFHWCRGWICSYSMPRFGMVIHDLTEIHPLERKAVDVECTHSRCANGSLGGRRNVASRASTATHHRASFRFMPFTLKGNPDGNAIPQLCERYRRHHRQILKARQKRRRYVLGQERPPPPWIGGKAQNHLAPSSYIVEVGWPSGVRYRRMASSMGHVQRTKKIKLALFSSTTAVLRRRYIEWTRQWRRIRKSRDPRTARRAKQTKDMSDERARGGFCECCMPNSTAEATAHAPTTHGNGGCSYPTRPYNGS